MIIYKCEIPIEKKFTLNLPESAKVLKVDTQFGKPQMWILHNQSHTLIRRHFALITTGEEFDYIGRKLFYIGTFMLDDGMFVGHIFEEMI